MANKSRVRSTKAALKMLQTFFEDTSITNKERRNLWNVLSGLRGPDNEDNALKRSVTSVIRYHALGRSSHEHFGSYANPDNEQYLRDRHERMEQYYSPHFNYHAEWAFEALGLDINKVNPSGD